MAKIKHTLKVLSILVSMAMLSVTFANTAGATSTGVDVPNRKGMTYTLSENDFETTWGNIIATIEANPNLGILSQIDHAAAAASVGLDLEPNRVVFFGNPNIGTPLMQISRTVGIDLPQRMHVIEQDGNVFVGYNTADFLGARHNLEGAPQLATIAGALNAISNQGTGEDQPSRTRDAGSFERNDRLRTVNSNADFDTTLQRLRDAIGASPAGIFLEIDHAANAANAGLDLPPTTVVVFGNPNIGTPLIADSATVGIDLPLKIMVWEDENGQVKVTGNRVNIFRNKHKVSKSLFQGLRGVTNNFLAAASGH